MIHLLGGCLGAQVLHRAHLCQLLRDRCVRRAAFDFGAGLGVCTASRLCRVYGLVAHASSRPAVLRRGLEHDLLLRRVTWLLLLLLQIADQFAAAPRCTLLVKRRRQLLRVLRLLLLPLRGEQGL